MGQAQALAQRVARRQRHDLGQHVGVAPHVELERHALFLDGGAPLAEPDGRALDEGAARTGECLVPPQRQCLGEPGDRRFRAPVRGARPPGRDERLEPLRVDRVVVDDDEVPRRPRADHVGFPDLGEPGP